MINRIKNLFSSEDRSLNSRINAAIDRVKLELRTMTTEKAHVTHFGATDIDPKHLAVWLCVQSDLECERLEKENLEIRQRVHACFRAEDYPEAAVPFIGVGIASQETVTRDYDGNWWYFFK